MNLRILFLNLFVFLNTAGFSSAFDIQNFIKSSLEKTTPMYVKEVPISQHIQLFDMLSKHLQAESNRTKAVPVALALISFGATPYRTGLPQPSNEQERNILTQALYSAVRYLRQQDALSEEGVVAFIESKTKIFQDASQQDYMAYLSSVLLSAYRDHFGAYSFVENKPILIAPLAATWLKERLAQDSYWQYLDAYWIQNRSGTSSAAGLEKPKPAGIVPGLAKSLSETADLNEASTYANDLFNILRTQSDFSLLISASSDQAAQSAPLIPALIRLEKFRLADNKRARYASPLDYYVPDAKNKTSQAVVISLVTAIQKSLENPKRTASKLLELIRYQKNSRVLAQIKAEMDGIFSTGAINLLVTENLIKQIQETPLTISEKQQTAMVEEANKEQRISYDVPFFDQEKGEQQIKQLPVYYFGSSTRGSECGFFSLGFQGREQAISQIVDNLVENNIYVLANKVSGASGEIKAFMRRYLTKNEALPSRALDLYAKNHNLNRQDEKLLETLVTGYKALEDQVTKAEAVIDEECEALKKEKGLPAKVPAEDDGTIATAFQLLRKPFEHRKWFEQAKITQYFYPLSDFQDYILRKVHEKFRQGLLEFDPNPDWRLGTPSYPDIIATLNHCDIYSWVSPHVFKAMQASASATTPVYQTPDKAFILTSFISGGKDARRIDILNRSGIHFEKWVNAADLCALSSAIHHKKEHGLPNTK